MTDGSDRTRFGVGRRVLLVEDNPDGREMLAMLLEGWGYEVRTAEDGEQGVQEALQWLPEAAIVDIGLPILSGYQVAERLRAEMTRPLLLIALTGYGQPEARERAFHAGFDAFLTKPADVKQLCRLLIAATGLAGA